MAQKKLSKKAKTTEPVIEPLVEHREVKGHDLVDDIDAILDEIDEVLGDNEAEIQSMVANYVQKPGQ